MSKILSQNFYNSIFSQIRQVRVTTKTGIATIGPGKGIADPIPYICELAAERRAVCAEIYNYSTIFCLYITCM